jgi:hypothetical protein
MLKALKWTVDALGALIGGLWLLLLYVFTIWVAVGSLTAIQVRGDLGSAEEAVSFDRVSRAMQKYEQRVATIQDQVARLNFLDRTYYDMELTLRQVRHLIGVQGDYVNVWQDALTPEFVAAKVDCAVDAAGAMDPKLCELIDRYDGLAAAADRYETNGLGDPYEKIRAEAATQIERLEATEPMFRYFETYRFFRDWNYRTFLHVPHEVLVLVLTMAMGMLGSVVTMTWLFIRKTGETTVRRFLILPFIGSMSAVVIYVFLSAGQLTLTSGEPQDSLNPFVLSFIGIISGLLSERAYNRIADVGGNFFKIDDGQPRWGLNLSQALDAAGVTTAELALHLDTTEEEAARIVDEATTATLVQQRLIAACLRRNPREIFTDQPPDGPSAQAAAAHVIVPDVVGLDAAAAAARLREAGLEPGEPREAAHPSAAPGTVLDQSLPARSRAGRGAVVTLTLAAGPAPTATG